MVRLVRVWLLAASLSLVGLSAAAAQEDAEESRAAAFRAVEGATTEDVPGGALMIAAYMTALVLLVGYVARLGMMQRHTADEVTRLAELLAQHEPKQD